MVEEMLLAALALYGDALPDADLLVHLGGCPGAAPHEPCLGGQPGRAQTCWYTGGLAPALYRLCFCCMALYRKAVRATNPWGYSCVSHALSCT
jgi:hypothetical protein